LRSAGSGTHHRVEAADVAIAYNESRRRVLALAARLEQQVPIE
jgi:hypothetical protein